MKKIDEATPEQLKETLNFLNSLETARNDSFTAPLEDLKKQSNELKRLCEDEEYRHKKMKASPKVCYNENCPDVHLPFRMKQVVCHKNCDKRKPS